jgi:uncharacterized tellurite resistance protein B-like protein
MDRLLFRKINLLVHLAHVDGKFHDSEKELLRVLLAEKGLSDKFLEEHNAVPIDFEKMEEVSDKVELLFWVLKLIHADDHLHADELAFAKVIASQLGFKSQVIDHYHTAPTGSLRDFDQEVQAYKIPNS